jgi:hypothetical protein
MARRAFPRVDDFPSEFFTTQADPEPWEDETPNDNEKPQSLHQSGDKAGVGGPKSRHVGWRLVDAKGDLLYVAGASNNSLSSEGPDEAACAFGFKINPQGIDLDFSTRSTLFATRSHFIVDNFGRGPTTITLRQLVASGRDIVDPTGRAVIQQLTAREDIQRFIERIWYPAIHRSFKGTIQFFDNHYERGVPVDVFFPPNSLRISRAVELHGIWRVDITMVALEKDAYSPGDGIVVTRPKSDPTKTTLKTYTVKKGDGSLEKLSRKLIHAATHHSPTAKQVSRLKKLIIHYNPELRTKKRLIGNVTKTAKPFQLLPGQKLKLPQKVS